MKPAGQFFLFCLFVSTLISCEQSSPSSSKALADEKNKETFETKKGEKEAEFIADAVQQKLGEIKLAELASAKSSNKKLQDFAQRMAADQTESLSRFQDLARKKGITLPIEEGDDAKEKVNELSEVEGRQFDEKWSDEIISKHEKTLRDFNKMSKKFEDAQLSEVLRSATKTLEMQLQELRNFRENIK
ncbi:DUF4142 domain-containing protein [Chryseolinea sp. H1M3-3]|uniref:DUF4142 domain-containing protein n=1 Tax=Chryseolinea sp. H1M3-3 TaxID=3034144 RepID=UPI0023EBC9CE|nr:DUF4142 domain-containing protein [Chryseolinea sp. H1M3-3]